LDAPLLHMELLTMRMTLSGRRFVLAMGSVLASLIALGVVFFVQSSANERPPSTELFSIFSKPMLHDPRTAAELAVVRNFPNQDLSQLRVIGRGLGRFNSRLAVFPANDGRNICYSLLGSSAADPGMGYCFAPASPYAPPETAGEHFSVAALESATDGQIRVQVFGVALDDVAKVRVQVAGGWRAIRLAPNGFYLDLPGVHHEEVGIVEVTLDDGSVQRHDIQTGSRAP
jgi:hypothetical protein